MVKKNNVILITPFHVKGYHYYMFSLKFIFLIDVNYPSYFLIFDCFMKNFDVDL